MKRGKYAIVRYCVECCYHRECKWEHVGQTPCTLYVKNESRGRKCPSY